VKRIEAFVRVNKLEEVKQALEEIDQRGITVEQVRGYGRQLGQSDQFRGNTYALNLVPKVKIEAVVTDNACDEAIEAIIEAAQTGELGDGKIFVSDVVDAVRIRTGERGESALQ
jgi:nitrogen regulatory protein P-II 1